MKSSGKNSPPPTPLSVSSEHSSPLISYQFRWPTRKSQRRRRRQILEPNFGSSCEEERGPRRNPRSTRNPPQIKQTQPQPKQQRKISKQVVFRPGFRPGTPPPSVPIRAQALSYDPNLLAPPSAYEIGLTQWEAPPHKRDTVEKIPIRARSQSWLIRTRHLLDDEKVDLRVLSFDVPPQEILSRDSVTVSVEAVIYFRISNPVISVTNVNDAQFSTKLLAQTTLRNVLGTKTLSEILMERDIISNITEKVLDDGTDPWGVKVERVEIKDIRLPQQLMKSMAAEAEAARDARAKIIAADGERSASRQLVQAADIVCGNKVSLHLRYLQTLIRISSQHNHTYVKLKFKIA
uniref:Band 7 domain-containing protein n=1 Tax=Meloidogyne javanica TaxID=6303 RepID=A0A915MH76_MELJA